LTVTVRQVRQYSHPKKKRENRWQWPRTTDWGGADATIESLNPNIHLGYAGRRHTKWNEDGNVGLGTTTRCENGLNQHLIPRAEEGAWKTFAKTVHRVSQRRCKREHAMPNKNCTMTPRGLHRKQSQKEKTGLE